ncbi:MAG: hypothetical protein IPM84_14045 [Anaerolineae bacterium]|nr:hypothetical protein [Anaerolineae bacterium]
MIAEALRLQIPDRRWQYGSAITARACLAESISRLRSVLEVGDRFGAIKDSKWFGIPPFPPDLRAGLGYTINAREADAGLDAAFGNSMP